MTTLNNARDYQDPDLAAQAAANGAEDDDDHGTGDGDEDAGEDEDPDSSGGDAEIEARARTLGWVPEHEWDDRRAEAEGRRKPARFFTAKEWLDRMEVSGPILRATVRKLEKDLAEAKKQGEDIYGILQEQRKLQEAAIERAKKEEREKIEQERRQAIAEGDVEAFDKAEAKLKEHDGQGQKPNGPGNEDPEIVAFKDANKTWFTVDARLTNNMIDEFAEVKADMPGATLRVQLEEAKKRVMNRFPEKFGINPRRENARRGPTPPTGGADQGSVDRRFAALTPEEKGAWERVRKMVESRGDTITKADWLKGIGR